MTARRYVLTPQPTDEFPSRSFKRIVPFVVSSALGSISIALLFWFSGALPGLVPAQASILLALILVLNFTPAVLELTAKRFDPFDLKHLFLGYFFLTFTLPSACVIWLGLDPSPEFAPQLHSDSVEVRSLASVLLGLSTFLVGCYVSISGLLGIPRLSLPRTWRARVLCCSVFGISVGIVAFCFLMRLNGGLYSFLSNRASWRTEGVISGVGYLTFPIDAILPAAALFLLMAVLPDSKQKLSWTTILSFILAGLSLLPAVILGFRGEIVPIVLQTLAAWHYSRRRLPITGLFLFACVFVFLLSIFGASRDASEDDAVTGKRIAKALIFRLPGLDTVERVVSRLDNGEPYRGPLANLRESATILLPRAVWPSKPEPSSLAFSDIFFSDYFINRGDPIDAVKSGIAPTYVGDCLWIGGLPFVAIVSFAFGIFALFAVEWRRRGGFLHLFVYVIVMSRFPLFVEAYQNTCNLFVMYALLCCLFIFATVFRTTAAKSHS